MKFEEFLRKKVEENWSLKVPGSILLSLFLKFKAFFILLSLPTTQPTSANSSNFRKLSSDSTATNAKNQRPLPPPTTQPKAAETQSIFLVSFAMFFSKAVLQIHDILSCGDKKKTKCDKIK
jgi:hypothetical protein